MRESSICFDCGINRMCFSGRGYMGGIKFGLYVFRLVGVKNINLIVYLFY